MKSEAQKRNQFYLYGICFTALLVVVVLVAGWYFAFRISSESGKIKTEGLYLNEESDKKTEIVQKYNRVLDYQAVATDAIPSSKEISSFLADVEGLATRSGLTISSSTIGATQKAKTNNPGFSQTINKNEYYELPIKYEMRGSYQGFLTFLSDIKGLRRLNTVSELKVTKIAATSGGDAVTLNFIASIFIKK